MTYKVEKRQKNITKNNNYRFEYIKILKAIS